MGNLLIQREIKEKHTDLTNFSFSRSSKQNRGKCEKANLASNVLDELLHFGLAESALELGAHFRAQREERRVVGLRKSIN